MGREGKAPGPVTRLQHPSPRRPLLAGFMLVLEGQLEETVYGEEAC